MNIRDWVISMRPKHWIKSGFCVAPLIFSGQASDLAAWLQIIPLLAGFCLLSSGGYLLNDVINLEEDARHPRKCRRPLAAGRLKRVPMIIVGLCLALLGWLLLHWQYGGGDGLIKWTPLVGLGYFLITVSYSLFLRDLPVFDVLVLGLGFVSRVLAGAFALDLGPTVWLLSCTYAIVLLLGFGKRQGEWRVIEQRHQELGKTRKALKGYTPMLLNVLCGFFALLAGVLYMAYCMTRPDRELFLLTGIPVIAGLMSYLRLVWRSKLIDAPEDLFLRTPSLLGSVIIWVLLIIFIPMIDGA